MRDETSFLFLDKEAHRIILEAVRMKRLSLLHYRCLFALRRLASLEDYQPQGRRLSKFLPPWVGQPRAIKLMREVIQDLSSNGFNSTIVGTRRKAVNKIPEKVIRFIAGDASFIGDRKAEAGARSELLLLGAYLHYRRHKEHGCFLRNSAIRRLTGLHPKSIRVALDALVRSGVLKVRQRTAAEIRRTGRRVEDGPLFITTRKSINALTRDLQTELMSPIAPLESLRPQSGEQSSATVSEWYNFDHSNYTVTGVEQIAPTGVPPSLYQTEPLTLPNAPQTATRVKPLRIELQEDEFKNESFKNCNSEPMGSNDSEEKMSANHEPANLHARIFLRLTSQRKLPFKQESLGKIKAICERLDRQQLLQGTADQFDALCELVIRELALPQEASRPPGDTQIASTPSTVTTTSTISVQEQVLPPWGSLDKRLVGE
ncbi:MAG: hypothetical protein EBZ48_11770 [Proteobacteria bacterium]|nr:hypothetical protein [Pseudomonadota bacterium]